MSAGQNIGFVGVEGTRFVLNGRPFHFAGTNNYYQMIHRRGGYPTVDEVMDEMAARQLTVLRTFIFQDLAERSDCLQCAPARMLAPGERPIDFISPTTLAALDQTLAAADARGIRLVLTLVNNWDDFGGMNRYTLWRFGYTDHDRFYTDATIRDWFKELIALLVHRTNTVNGRLYRDDPTIFAWQLANEPRAASGTIMPAQFDAWIGEMSGFIKNLDPNHLVSTGSEGFYGPARASRNTDTWMTFQGMDFVDNHLHPTIDYATCHVWPQNWGWNPLTNTNAAVTKTMTYVQRRLEDSANAIGKPLVIEEFGVPRDNAGAGLNSGPTTIRERFYRDVFYSLCESSALSGGPCGGTAFWILFDDASAAYDDGNGVFFPSDAALDEIITRHAKTMAGIHRGDTDFDGDVDSADLHAVRDCISGRGVPPAAGCEKADMDRDGDVDQTDFGLSQRCANGRDTPPAPGCAE